MQIVFSKDGKPEIGWVIGLDQGYTKLDDRNVWLCGMSFGMIIDHQLSIMMPSLRSGPVSVPKSISSGS
jgi:hypothetical protein